MLDKVTMQDHP